nr:hypothetical protein HmN_000893500 [Hymenolepis microstoma]
MYDLPELEVKNFVLQPFQPNSPPLSTSDLNSSVHGANTNISLEEIVTPNHQSMFVLILLGAHIVIDQ